VRSRSPKTTREGRGIRFQSSDEMEKKKERILSTLGGGERRDGKVQEPHHSIKGEKGTLWTRWTDTP